MNNRIRQLLCKTDEYSRSKLTLKYRNKESEINYLDSIFEFKKIQMLFIMGLTLIIYILITAFDFLILNEMERTFAVPFHISMIILWLYLIPSIYYNKSRKIAVFILYLMPIYAVLGTLLFAYYYNPVYIIDIYIIIFWSSVAIGYMFLESVIITTIMAMSSAIILRIFNIIEFEEYMLHLLMMITAWMIGLCAGYIIELFSRKNYEKKVEIIEIKDKLKEQANRDYLTDLYNRRYFSEIAENFIKTVKRERKELSVIMLDIDNFKNINDIYGHAVGDMVIKSLASLLHEHTRDSDVVSRFGGEEFAILLPFTNREGAFKIAEELRGVIENQNIQISNDKDIKFTVSIGVDCLNRKVDSSISESLGRADKALYRAKNEGRNQVCCNKDLNAMDRN